MLLSSRQYMAGEEAAKRGTKVPTLTYVTYELDRGGCFCKDETQQWTNYCAMRVTIGQL